MDYMFQSCIELEYLDLSNINTCNATNMEFMFNQCKKLKEIKGINNFNTSNVITMCAMFNECTEIKFLDLSNFNTGNVTNMGQMFHSCKKLKEIKGINNFNTKNVTIMKLMFYKCYELEYLDLSNFNTSNVTGMEGMFFECHNLEYIDLSNFNTEKVTDMENMFYKCHKLKEIKGIDKFNISNVINKLDIFKGCKNLKNYNELEYLFSDNNPNLQLKKNVNLVKKDITINFISIDQNIKFTITCSNLDIFSTVLEKLYLEFPELKEKSIYFIVNGNIINKLYSLERNKIRNGNQILINMVEN